MPEPLACGMLARHVHPHRPAPARPRRAPPRCPRAGHAARPVRPAAGLAACGRRHGPWPAVDRPAHPAEGPHRRHGLDGGQGPRPPGPVQADLGGARQRRPVHQRRPVAARPAQRQRRDHRHPDPPPGRGGARGRHLARPGAPERHPRRQGDPGPGRRHGQPAAGPTRQRAPGRHLEHLRCQRRVHDRAARPGHRHRHGRLPGPRPARRAPGHRRQLGHLRRRPRGPHAEPPRRRRAHQPPRQPGAADHHLPDAPGQRAGRLPQRVERREQRHRRDRPLGPPDHPPAGSALRPQQHLLPGLLPAPAGAGGPAPGPGWAVDRRAAAGLQPVLDPGPHAR